MKVMVHDRVPIGYGTRGMPMLAEFVGRFSYRRA
jgi:hypothetical protein